MLPRRHLSACKHLPVRLPYTMTVQGRRSEEGRKLIALRRCLRNPRRGAENAKEDQDKNHKPIVVTTSVVLTAQSATKVATTNLHNMVITPNRSPVLLPQWARLRGLTGERKAIGISTKRQDCEHADRRQLPTPVCLAGTGRRNSEEPKLDSSLSKVLEYYQEHPEKFNRQPNKEQFCTINW